MRKVLCVCCILVLVLGAAGLTGCGSAEREESQKEGGQLKRTEEMEVTEQVMEINPSNPKLNQIIGADDNYYYFAGNDEKWKFLQVEKKNPENMKEFGKKQETSEINLQYVWNGAVYVGAASSDPKDETFTGDYDKLTSPGTYRIIKLQPGKKPKEIFRTRTMGYPQVIPAGSHIAVEENSGKKISLRDINLETGKKNLIFEGTYKRAEEGGNLTGIVLGTMLKGWPGDNNPAPDSRGICYQVCQFDDEHMLNEDHPGDNEIRFYTFGSKEQVRLEKHPRPVSYAGGTEKAYVTCDYPDSQKSEAAFIKLYMQNDEDDRILSYDFPKKDRGAANDLDAGLAGSCLLSEKTLLVYSGERFFIIDLEKKHYLVRTFSKDPAALETDQLLGLSYKQKVTGMTSGEKVFLFSTECDGEKGRKGTIEVHELTARE